MEVTTIEFQVHMHIISLAILTVLIKQNGLFVVTRSDGQLVTFKRASEFSDAVFKFS